LSNIFLITSKGGKNLPYNNGKILWERNVMPRFKKSETKAGESFGSNMARLRKDRGYSQRDLARETGISQRMISYYEKQANYPPTHILPVLAEALGLTVDQLLGRGNGTKDKKSKDMRLWRRFSQIEKMNPKEKRKMIQLLDTFIENERLRGKAE
jgi:transcriptional regulator with XRE-family HTH domain